MPGSLGRNKPQSASVDKAVNSALISGLHGLALAPALHIKTRAACMVLDAAVTFKMAKIAC